MHLLIQPQAKSIVMPKDCRPEDIGCWIASARPSKLLVIKAIDTFPDRWLRWWHERQPSARISNGKLVFPTEAVAWTPLDYHGDNGVLGFIVGLYSWGKHMQDHGWKETDRKKWLGAVQDASWALHQMVKDKPEQASDDESETAPNPRDQEKCVRFN